MRSRWYISLLFLLAGAALGAQNTCFRHFFEQGQRALRSPDIQKWGDAELYFQAAFHCLDNTPDDRSKAMEWKNRAKEKYIVAILEARDSTEKANQLLRRQSLISAALSWSFFAQEEAAKDSFDVALALAYQAYRFVRENPNPFTPLVQKAFGNTVYARQNQALRGHEAAIMEIWPAPQSATVLTRSRDNTVRVWNAQTDKDTATLGPHRGFVHAMAGNPDGSRILTASADSTARLWARDGTLLRELTGHTDEVIAAAIAADGRMLTGCRDGSARLWSAEGDLIKALPGHDGPVWLVAFAKEGGKMLTASANAMKLWDNGGNFYAILEGHSGYIYSARFSPDGNKVLIASAGGAAILWNLLNNSSVPLKGHTDIVYDAGFSDKGDRVLTISTDGSARVWSGAGDFLAALPDHAGRITSACFSPDGSKVLVVSKNKTARLWDIHDVKNPTAVDITGHSDEIRHARFSPDGQSLLTASADRTAKLWDLKGNVLLDINGFDAAVLSTAFSADGRQLLAASADGNAVICEDPERVFQQLQQNPPQLTAEQKRRFEMRD